MARGEPVFNSVAENLAAIRARMAEACRRAGRPADSVRLLAVSKLVPAERVADACNAGVELLGENRVQEAAAKRPALAQLLPHLRPPQWHLIGPLQSNKAGKAVELFDVVESLDSLALAQRLQRLWTERAQAAARPLPVFLQVNVGQEAQKHGVAPVDLPPLAEAIVASCPALRLRGLMTVPPFESEVENARRWFAGLRQALEDLQARLGDRIGSELSMGMSGDFPAAIAEGATLIRVGSALFGTRPPNVAEGERR